MSMRSILVSYWPWWYYTRLSLLFTKLTRGWERSHVTAEEDNNYKEAECHLRAAATTSDFTLLLYYYYCCCCCCSDDPCHGRVSRAYRITSCYNKGAQRLVSFCEDWESSFAAGAAAVFIGCRCARRVSGDCGRRVVARLASVMRQTVDWTWWRGWYEVGTSILRESSVVK